VTDLHANAVAQVGKSYSSPREALFLNARFVVAQLSALDGTPAAGGVKFAELPFTATLIKEVRISWHLPRSYVPQCAALHCSLTSTSGTVGDICLSAPAVVVLLVRQCIRALMRFAAHACVHGNHAAT